MGSAWCWRIIHCRYSSNTFKALSDNGAFFRKDRTPPELFKFPDFGAHELQPSAISNICSSLLANVNHSLVSLSDTPSVLVTEAMCSVWYHVLHSVTADLLESANVKRILTSMKEVKSHVYCFRQSELLRRILPYFMMLWKNTLWCSSRSWPPEPGTVKTLQHFSTRKRLELHI